MKYKTSELEGWSLDAAVAVCEGWTPGHHPAPELAHVRVFRKDGELMMNWGSFMPSTDWHCGGEIIERERIAICFGSNAAGWLAAADEGMGDDEWGHCSSTPLIAAMRAFVHSKLGEEVELP